MIALTRDISPAIGRCELTHLARTPLDVDRARAQHDAYERALRALGCTVERLEAGDDMPDSVFIEDTAVVVSEVAIVARPGAESRRGETAAVARALESWRSAIPIEPPGTLDGGDVLVIGKRVFVGESARTNAAAIHQLRAALRPFGYEVQPAAVHGCLHLKSAVTALSDEAVLLNPNWVAADAFSGLEPIAVHHLEPMGANVLRVGAKLLYASAYPRTADQLVTRGFHVGTIDVSELAKAEGALTCCSLLIET